MLTRRTLAMSLTAALVAASASAQAPAPSEPAAIVTAIYTRAAAGKGGGAFIIASKAAKTKYLSKSLVALWAKADAHTPKGDVGPVDFDPVTNSQEPDVKSFTVTAEQSEADKATIAAALIGHHTTRKAPDQTVRYDFVREANQWKIDDIRGADDGKPWSIREMLKAALKS